MKKLLLPIICALFLCSCSTEKDSNGILPNTNNENSNFINLNPTLSVDLIIPDSLEYLKNYLVDDLGYSEDEISFSDITFYIQTDIMASIESLKYNFDQRKKRNEGIDPSAHYATSSCGVSSPIHSCRPGGGRGDTCDRDNEIYEIYVIFHPSLPNTWQQATLNAMEEWNDLSNNRIRFIHGNYYFCLNRFEGVRITLYSESDPTVIARADTPSGGSPGDVVQINTNATRYNSNDIAALTRVMTHEFGHTIGFHHTNETDGCFISGSASSDVNSIMNAQLDPSLSGFSNQDIIAHDLLYPIANNNAQIIEFSSKTSSCVPY